MPNEVRFTIEPREITNSFYDLIDSYMSRIGYKVRTEDPNGDLSSASLLIHKGKEHDFVQQEWPPYDYEFSKDDSFKCTFTPSGKRDVGNLFTMYVTLDVAFCDKMIMSRIELLTRIHYSYRGPYNEMDIDTIHRLLKLAALVHEDFKSSETKCFEKHADEPWLTFRTTEHIPHINFEPYEISKGASFREWLLNPDIIIDYYSPNVRPSMDSPWNPKLPFNYDTKHNEYHLIYDDNTGTEHCALVRNDLTFGACKLPESSRDKLYDYPSDEEKQRMRTLAWTSMSLKDVIKQLGEPQIVLPSVRYTDEYSRSDRDINGQICYTELLPTSVPIFREYKNGLITVVYAGKQKMESV